MGKPRKHNLDLPQRVYIKGPSYYFVDTDNKWHNLGRDYYQAMIRFAELNSVDNLITMEHLFNEYQSSIIDKSISSQKDILQQLKLLRLAFSHMKPNEITPRHIYQYMDARNANARANKEKATLSNTFNIAIRKGLISTNPCREVKSYPSKPRKRYVTDDEFWIIHNLMPKPHQIAMMLAWITGARQHSILDLKYSQCTTEGIEIDTAKGGKDLLVEWNADLRSVVEASTDTTSNIKSFYLVHNKKGQKYTRDGFSSMFRRTIKKAVTDGKITEPFTFHDLRAKAGTDTTDERLLGHQNAQIFRKYYVRNRMNVTGNSIHTNQSY